MEELKKLYLKGWEYNSYLIINELGKLILKNNGKIVYDFPYINTYKKIEIQNRSIFENIAENENILKNKTKEEIKQNNYLQEKQKELEELKKIDNTPKQVNFSNYLHFELDGFIYYIQLQDNPFFDDYILKEEAEKTEDGYITKYSYYMENLKKEWIEKYSNIDSFYQNLTEKQIQDLAKRLFEQIKNTRPSEIVTEKKRIPNYYDSSYHYENIKEKRTTKYKIIDILEV